MTVGPQQINYTEYYSSHISVKQILNDASRIECKKCKALLSIEEFIAHSSCNHTCINSLKEPHLNEKELLRKLWITEKALREMTSKSVIIERKYEKSKAELQKLRIICAQLESQQEKAEVSLKSEIKFLISKLSQTKQKLAQNVEKTSNLGNIKIALEELASRIPKDYLENSPSIGSKYENKYTPKKFLPAESYDGMKPLKGLSDVKRTPNTSRGQNRYKRSTIIKTKNDDINNSLLETSDAANGRRKRYY